MGHHRGNCQTVADTSVGLPLHSDDLSWQCRRAIGPMLTDSIPVLCMFATIWFDWLSVLTFTGRCGVPGPMWAVFSSRNHSDLLREIFPWPNEQSTNFGKFSCSLVALGALLAALGALLAALGPLLAALGWSWPALEPLLVGCPWPAHGCSWPALGHS